MIRLANFKKASQEEQQNQTATTNINYIKNFMSVLKTKLNNEVKTASDKTKTKQNNLLFTRRDMGLAHNRACEQLDNREQKQ